MVHKVIRLLALYIFGLVASYFVTLPGVPWYAIAFVAIPISLATLLGIIALLGALRIASEPFASMLSKRIKAVNKLLDDFKLNHNSNNVPTWKSQYTVVLSMRPTTKRLVRYMYLEQSQSKEVITANYDMLDYIIEWFHEIKKKNDVNDRISKLMSARRKISLGNEHQSVKDMNVSRIDESINEHKNEIVCINHNMEYIVSKVKDLESKITLLEIGDIIEDNME